MAAKLYMTLREAGALACCSRGKLYTLAIAKKIEFVKLAGRTLATVESVDRYLKSAVPYVPDGRDPRGAARATAKGDGARAVTLR